KLRATGPEWKGDMHVKTPAAAAPRASSRAACRAKGLLTARGQPFRDATMFRAGAFAVRGVRVQAILALGNRATGISVLMRARLAGRHAGGCGPTGARRARVRWRRGGRSGRCR